MRTGIYISGTAHAALILWLLIAGLFVAAPDLDLEFTEVTLMSGEEFEAMLAGAEAVPDVSDAPATPEAPEETAAPTVPEPDTAPETAASPDAAETTPPDESPDVTAVAPLPQAEVTPDAPDAPADPDTPEGAAVLLNPDATPRPRSAPRIAPTPAAQPEPDAQVADEVTEATRPDESAAVETVSEPEEATAPEEAATQTVPEDEGEDGGDVVAALAPTGSTRPKTRPARPAPTPAETETETASTDAQADAIAAAVAEAASEPAAPARTGPPLTGGEKDKLRLGVQKCWNVGSLSSEALRVTVIVGVTMQEDGRPDNGSIHMIGAEGGSTAAANQAYEAARRAIIRCGAKGYDLPPEKFAQWREIEMVFNPEKMRIR